MADVATRVQEEIDSLFDALNGDELLFTDVYLLPGDGEYEGVERFDHARRNAAIVSVLDPVTFVPDVSDIPGLFEEEA